MEKKGDRLRDNLARNIKRAREKLGYTQQELSERADLSSGHMNDLEQGRKWVSAETLQRVADALMVDPWMLLLPEASGDQTAQYDLLTSFASRIKDNVNTTVAETLRELLRPPRS